MEALIRDIEEAHVRRDTRAVHLQQTWLRFGLVAAVLGPIAVGLLALQVLVRPAGGLLAKWLISTEVLVLFVAVMWGFLRIGEGRVGWVDERLRAELLRRELFLLSARVGPYLGIDAAAASVLVKQRLSILDSDLEEPLPLLALKHAGVSAWTHALEDAYRAGHLEAMPDLSSRAKDYLDKRVAGQRTWFIAKASAHASRDRILEYGAKLVLTLALMVASIHLGMLAIGEPHTRLAIFLVMLAFLLPPLGAAFVGVRALLEGHRISRSYLHHARALAEIEQELTELQQPGVGDAKGATLRFQRLVLQTEELLAAELRQWWFVMRPSVPTAEA
jgi:SMODS and SLOG-associating 2TM effector domain 1